MSRKTELSSLLLKAAERLSVLEAVVFGELLDELNDAVANGTSRRKVMLQVWQYATTTTMAQASLRALAAHLMGEEND